MRRNDRVFTRREVKFSLIALALSAVVSLGAFAGRDVLVDRWPYPEAGMIQAGIEEAQPVPGFSPNYG